MTSLKIPKKKDTGRPRIYSDTSYYERRREASRRYYYKKKIEAEESKK
jgi:hypothetical protein